MFMGCDYNHLCVCGNLKMDDKKIITLRDPFPAHQIKKLPKPSTKQTEEVKANFKLGIRCKICGSWHHPDVVHVDYVGHAALTDRLLDVDPNWTWRPLALGANGLPLLDSNGGLWLELTVLGLTRLGYGDAAGKSGGDAIKEAIGDGLRNAAMRGGAALQLWHKGELHLTDDTDTEVMDEEKLGGYLTAISESKLSGEVGKHYLAAIQEASALKDQSAMDRLNAAKSERMAIIKGENK